MNLLFWGGCLSQESGRVVRNYFSSPTLPKMKEELLTDVQRALNIINQVDFIFLPKAALNNSCDSFICCF